jgi:hypothetical protein
MVHDLDAVQVDVEAGRDVGGVVGASAVDREVVVALVDVLGVQRDLGEAFDRELVEEAMARVQARVRPRTWDAFRLTALEGLSGAAAAERLRMKVARVFTAKSQVQQLLAEEVRALERPDPD